MAIPSPYCTISRILRTGEFHSIPLTISNMIYTVRDYSNGHYMSE